mmetsp:Transcript_19968/g.40345  ORF Transcript_19968/g.40345 Transcript_19968/m.40345 type:complete len:266 (-) Transcript_19968:2935-3732(-)
MNSFRSRSNFFLSSSISFFLRSASSFAFFSFSSISCIRLFFSRSISIVFFSNSLFLSRYPGWINSFFLSSLISSRAPPSPNRTILMSLSSTPAILFSSISNVTVGKGGMPVRTSFKEACAQAAATALTTFRGFLSRARSSVSKRAASGMPMLFSDCRAASIFFFASADPSAAFVYILYSHLLSSFLASWHSATPSASPSNRFSETFLKATRESHFAACFATTFTTSSEPRPFTLFAANASCASRFALILLSSVASNDARTLARRK